jgi:hypothetical protein
MPIEYIAGDYNRSTTGVFYLLCVINNYPVFISIYLFIYLFIHARALRRIFDHIRMSNSCASPIKALNVLQKRLLT